MDSLVCDGTDPEPVGVVDRLLWRDAQHMRSRHVEPDNAGLCVWCRRVWPCPARRLAERAETAAFQPWNEGWTVRGDLHSLRSMPSWRADIAGRSTPRHAAPHRAPFD